MKSKLVKIIVLAVIFAAVVAVAVVFNKDEEQEQVYAEWSDASLPVVNMNFEGERVNCLHGYTLEMEKSYMRDSITPISSDRNISMTIDTYGSKISGISYQVWSPDSEKLYVKKKCGDYDASADSFDVTFKLEDILSGTEEYQLVIVISTKDYKEIYYYTRIRYYDDTNISGILSYAKNFSSQALAGTLSNEMLYQLESDTSTDNTSFGYVNIKSTYNHVSWGDLSPQLNGDVNVTIKDFNQTIGSIMLEYEVTAENESGGTSVFDVDEFLCVQYVNNNYYLIAYERQAGERFEFSEDSISDNKIELGVVSGKNLPADVYVSGAYNVFAADGELWCYNSNSNSALRLFSFKESENDVRTLLDEHEYEVVSVDNDGNIQFTVAGYMNSGLHEGKCGVGFYKYTKETNTLNELFFIQSSRPYDVLKKETGTLSYMGENSMYYMTFGSSLYAVDFGGPEYVKITGRLNDGMYAVDEVNGIVAWQEQDEWSKCTSVRELFLDDSTEYTVEAEEGEYIRLLGFIDGDMIIGRAYSRDVVMEGSAVAEYPMYKFEIINRKHEKETEYNGNGLYISGITVENERLIINRQQKNEDGSFSDVAADVLLKNWESDEHAAKITSEIKDLRKRVYSVRLSSAATSKAFTVTEPELPGSVTGLLSLAASEESKEDVRYYAYSCGHLKGITVSVGDAINLVYDDMGVVVDSSLNYIWSRANRSARKQIMVSGGNPAETEGDTLAACVNIILNMEDKKVNVQKEFENGKSAYDILDSSLDNGALDLKGCLLNQVLYYVNNGSPVIVYTGKEKAELIVGYSGTSQVIMYDTMTQSTYTLTWQAAEELFNANGNVFLSYRK